MKRPAGFLFIALSVLAAGGCAKDTALERINHEQAATIQGLNQELKRVNSELDEVMASRSDFEKAKAEVEKSLEKEMAGGGLSVGLESRGLVVTVLDRLLYDSGRAVLKASSLATLDKLVVILQSELRENMVYVEGHTDNDPIRMSAWRSNWELSMARAAEVVHYFIETGQLNPKRLAATGYGEFHPVVENRSPETKSQNRRVEIVVSPKKVTE